MTVGVKINQGPIERAVLAFFAEQGIDPARVRTYSVTKTYDGLSIIKLTMIMNDIAPERSGNFVGEQGPASQRAVAERIADDHEQHRNKYAGETAGARAARLAGLNCMCAPTGFGHGGCPVHRKIDIGTEGE